MNGIKEVSLSVLSMTEMEAIQGGINGWACMGSAILFVAACASTPSLVSGAAVVGSGMLVIASCFE